MPRHIGTCFRFYTQMQVEKKNKAFAYRIYSHFTQQCSVSEETKMQNIKVAKEKRIDRNKKWDDIETNA